MRKIFDIPGGIHPAENKEQSLKFPIEPAGIPNKLVLPLSQHIGAPAEPVVNIGDKVLKGQQVAKAAGFVSVPIHAPTSGTVIAIDIQSVPHPSGMSAPCITIEPDGQEQWVECQGVEDYKSLEKPALVDLIRNAGIAGMGGAGFPSAVKLSPGPDAKIETLIINGTECEPYITADDILMRERAGQIIEGVQILAHLIEPEETVIGIEDNKPEAIKVMQAAAEGTGIEIATFPTKYPSGGEKQLIQILTGKEVPSGGLPAHIGVVVQNIGTATAIRNAVLKGEPLISRITTVTGEANAKQQNYEVLLGTPINHLLEKAGFDQKSAGRVIMGGPMMGFALESVDIPVVKTTNCILAPTPKELPMQDFAQACIRCGMCAEACPVSLLPQQMYWFAQGKEYEKLEDHNLFDCIECGCCSYVCPSNIPLVQYYRASKAAINQQKQDNQKSEHSRQRFEARQERLEREAAEKEAKRKARTQKAKAAAEKPVRKPNTATDDPDKQAVIQAALERSAAKKGAADPVQAAIERAQAVRAGGKVEESPEEKVAKLEKRLAGAQAKYVKAKEEGSDKLEAFEASLKNLQEKLDDARQAASATSAASDDPAQAAIERAKAARAGKAKAETPEEKIAKLEKRLANAQKKLDMARESDDDKLEVFETTVANLTEKLEEAKQTAPAETVESVPEPAPADDPAQAAIERAKAKRAGTAKPETAEEKVAKFEKRLANAQQKLDLARENNDDKLDVFETTVANLKQKLEEAKQELPASDAAPEPEPEPAPADDPVQAAIDRAKALRAGTAKPESSEEKIAKLEKRLAAAKEKLALAEQEGSDKIDAFQTSVTNIEQKLAAARAAESE